MIAPELRDKSRRAWIALGANLGDRQATLQHAIARLNASPGIAVLRVSNWMETEPVGGPPGQPTYLNGAAALQTTLSPRQLLHELLRIEGELGRDRSSNERNLPRTIDLDLLLCEDEIISEAGLTLPHPRMHEREFVLGPLAEIAPDVLHPVYKKSIRMLLQELQRRNLSRSEKNSG